MRRTQTRPNQESPFQMRLFENRTSQVRPVEPSFFQLSALKSSHMQVGVLKANRALQRTVGTVKRGILQYRRPEIRVRQVCAIKRYVAFRVKLSCFREFCV